MRRGLAAAGLLGFAPAGFAQAPHPQPLTQNEQGACVSAGVQDRFREPGSAEVLALEIVAGCIPERRAAGEADPRRAHLDQRYADERESAVETSVVLIERLRRNAAAARPVPKGEPTLTAPAAELIIRMARQTWREPTRTTEIVLQGAAAERPVRGSEWKSRSARRIELDSAGGRFATYYLDSVGRVLGLFINSSPPAQCRPFGARESFAVEAALTAFPAATADEVRQVRAAVRAGWTSGLLRIPARIGPYVLRASRIGASGPGRIGCHDHLSLSLADD
jgi:hypothetical protein